jgi:sortase A
MRRTSQRLRRVELALWALGILLVGVALVATSARWSYQAQQERAFSAALPELTETSAAEETPRRDPLPVTVTAPPVDWVSNPGPALGPAPAIPEQAEKKPAPKLGPTSTKAPRKPRQTAVDPLALGRIEIPRLGMRAIIRKGADEDTLDRAVGLVPGTAHPGEAGNIVLAAHRDTFFRPLRNIRVADRIRLVVPPHEYLYEVDSTRVVAPEETSVLQSRGTEELTLVTCYPFGFIGPAPDRFIVSAKRVQ